MPSGYAAAHRTRQTRRTGVGGAAFRLPGDVDRRDPHQPDQHAVPKPDGDGTGRTAGQPAHGLSRIVGGLRQNGPRRAHGCRFRRHPGDLPRRRSDVRRQLPGRTPRRLHRLSSTVDRLPRRKHRRGDDRSGQPGTGPHCRHLHGHGDGFHDGVHRRGDGHVATFLRHGSCSIGTTPPSGRPDRSSRCGDRRSRATAVSDHDRGRVPQCGDGAGGNLRLHQRDHPSHGDRPTARNRARPGRFPRPGRADAVTGGLQASRTELSAGHAPRRRDARPSEDPGTTPRPRRDDHHGPDPGCRPGRRRRTATVAAHDPLPR